MTADQPSTTLLITHTDGRFSKLSDIESDYIAILLALPKLKKTELAKTAGIGRSTLYRKLQAQNPAEQDKGGDNSGGNSNGDGPDQAVRLAVYDEKRNIREWKSLKHDIISLALEHCGAVSIAAEELGVGRNALYRRPETLEIIKNLPNQTKRGVRRRPLLVQEKRPENIIALPAFDDSGQARTIHDFRAQVAAVAGEICGNQQEAAVQLQIGEPTLERYLRAGVQVTARSASTLPNHVTVTSAPEIMRPMSCIEINFVNVVMNFYGDDIRQVSGAIGVTPSFVQARTTFRRLQLKTAGNG